jgi:zinc/manganese transport system substrate-binding protein
MRVRTILICCISAALAAGCGATRGRGLQVVASTNVYGDIARQIAGPSAHVTSILSDPNADPHLFEARTSNGLAVARAKVVIANGLGYDAFMQQLEQSTATHAVRLTVADALDVHGAEANPHLWYDLPALGKIGSAIAGALSRADPRHAGRYAAGRERFDASLAPLRRAVAALRAAHRGDAVASTEPVPDYLVAAAGLRELAPSAFTRAVADGTEPAPGALAGMLRLVRERRIRVLLYNTQAVSPITKRVRAAARAAHVPVVGVTETLPSGETYQSWQLRQVRALAAALGR